MLKRAATFPGARLALVGIALLASAGAGRAATDEDLLVALNPRRPG